MSRANPHFSQHEETDDAVSIERRGRKREAQGRTVSLVAEVSVCDLGCAA